ncbi:cereblon [Fistulifera solaris]|uniref:Cereblon n=1 Tax=Fistulifera solaris TaxID=1519565 RepID=A0A1Z5J883_FISSO|nr:cereblon [Fistulifera solaris]|eukprot:GAX10195.1 cereblon [Fistulifera solaris]
MEIPGILLFPGSLFPLRLSDAAWVNYLGTQITISRKCPSQAGDVCLGILAAKKERSLDRRSWTRQAFGPDRLRRLSMQLIQELGDLDDLSDDESNETEEPMRSLNNPLEDTSTTVDPSSSSPRQQQDRCGYIGRVGTIVTVMNTHGDEAGNHNTSDSSSVWRSVNEDGQLVLTTLATSRFRILGYCSADDEAILYERAILQQSFRRFFSANVPTFVVEVMEERPFEIPTSIQRPIVSSQRSKQKWSQNGDIISSLAMITPFPEFIYRKLLPWRLILLIQEEMASSPTFQAFLQCLPWHGDSHSTEHTDSDDASCGTLNKAIEENNPVKLSFWLASNLPFSENDKYRLLKMYNAVQRLEYIYQKIKERTEPLLCCQCCGLPLSRASSMFTVGGAEGTTGAYVNEHGFVHQTFTVRRLLSLSQRSPTSTSGIEGADVVSFSGGPQTKDSWFPGYSWTIMSCALCDIHLGWKFRLVQSCPREKESLERPDVFYGLSGASITITIPQ